MKTDAHLDGEAIAEQAVMNLGESGSSSSPRSERKSHDMEWYYYRAVRYSVYMIECAAVLRAV